MSDLEHAPDPEGRLIEYPNDWEDVASLDDYKLVARARSIYEAEEACRSVGAGDFLIMPPRLLHGVESWAVYQRTTPWTKRDSPDA